MIIKNEMTGIEEIRCEDLSKNLAQFKLIDVRRPDEYVGELGHIDGAQLLTLGPDLTDYLKKEDKNQSVVFICRSGARSTNSTLEALDMGFDKVYNMIGGMIEWNRLSLPTVK